MSISLMSNVWDNALDLNTGQTMVLLAMADYASDDGTNCWPAIPTLAGKARISKRQCQRIIKQLEEMGYIKRKITGGSVMSVTNHWHINIERVSEGVSICHGVPSMSPKPLYINSNSNDKEIVTINTNELDDTNDMGEVVSTWESVGMLMTPFASEEFMALLSEAPADWVVDAIKIAAQNNKRSLSYVSAIVRRWVAAGEKTVSKKQEKVLKNEYTYLATDEERVDWT